MTLQFINPEGLPTPATYSHVAVAAGSIPRDCRWRYVPWRPWPTSR
jgi:hypothetical protein